MSERYREIEVSGSPSEMGRQLGEAACEELRVQVLLLAC